MRNSALYRLDPDLSVHRLDSGIKCSNGPCWSPDNKTFYFCDSYDKVMYAYDYDIATGNVANRRTFLTAWEYPGTFDGSTVDAEGLTALGFDAVKMKSRACCRKFMARSPRPSLHLRR